jgi:hypothetical protein
LALSARLLHAARAASEQDHLDGSAAGYNELAMGALLEVERLDNAAALALAERVASRARVEVEQGESCCVRIDTEDASLAEVLHMLEDWTKLSGKQSLRVRLNGQTYILECRRAVT